MKTNFKTIAKDNIATAAALLAMFAGLVATVANSTTHHVDHAVVAATEMVKMDAIVVTAQRMPIEKMDAIVVTASRYDSRADVLVAAK
jgi:hypothetical protein